MKQLKIQNNIERAGKILGQLSQSNDDVIEKTSKLRIVLLNLKLNGSKMKDPADRKVITVISKDLERIINELHDDVNSLVQNHRQELKDDFKAVVDYINDIEASE